MGDILGSLFGAGASQAAGQAAAKADLTGFNYLNNSPYESQYIKNGAGANSQLAALLGLGGNQAGAQNAFNNYLNSTGYKFQLGQGTQAIEGNAASKGLLNSGAAAKALTTYGQGLAGQSFNNYLGQLSGMSSSGQTALGQVGEAGTTGGGNAGQAIYGGDMNAAQQGMNALGGIFGMFGI